MCGLYIPYYVYYTYMHWGDKCLFSWCLYSVYMYIDYTSLCICIHHNYYHILWILHDILCMLLWQKIFITNLHDSWITNCGDWLYFVVHIQSPGEQDRCYWCSGSGRRSTALHQPSKVIVSDLCLLSNTLCTSVLVQCLHAMEYLSMVWYFI